LVLATETITYKNSKEDSIIAFIYPISQNKHHPYGSVMFFVKESVLENMIENVHTDFNGNTYIFDEHNELLVSSIHNSEVSVEQIKDLQVDETAIQTVTIGDVKYSTMSVTSEVSGWTFVTIIDAEQFFGKVVKRELFVFILFGTVLVVGLIVVFTL